MSVLCIAVGATICFLSIFGANNQEERIGNILCLMGGGALIYGLTA